MDRKQIDRAEKIAQNLELHRTGQKSTPKTPRYSASELRQTQGYHDEMQRRKSARNLNLSQFGGVC
jgi:hypothetical protein